MRRKKPFVIHGFVLAIGVTFLTAADEVQVIRSGRSTLSIYNYGGLVPSRVLPEYRDSVRSFDRNSGVLTDVASRPGRAVSAPPIKSSTNATAAPKTIAGQTGGFSIHSMAAPSDAPSAPNEMPNPPTVTVGWNPSPEASVAGYHVYIGQSSGQYRDRITVENQTTAQLPLGQAAVYIAVSAFTSEGLESALSGELIVAGLGSEPAATSGGDRTSESEIH